MSLISQLESILFVATKPVSVGKLAELLQTPTDEIETALAQIQAEYQHRKGGIQLIQHNSKVQFTTQPDNRAVVETYLKEEQFSELTKPGLETLTIVAYRGPITKPELEAIRGVNCTMILRNLLIKGLVDATEDKFRMQTTYHVTFDFVRFLGLNQVSDLPDYAQLSQHESLDRVIKLNTQEST
jgi:segregation and condensation protein B